MKPILRILALVLLVLSAVSSTPNAATIHCCSDLQVSACRDTCKAQGCRSSVGCRAGECVCTCAC
jgi:hypothetical protein